MIFPHTRKHDLESKTGIVIMEYTRERERTSQSRTRERTPVRLSKRLSRLVSPLVPERP